MILIIDNYDSFVYNLARYLGELGCETHVVRNDCLSVGDARAMSPEAIVLSPGPCTPAEAGISVSLIRELSAEVPMLGVCLGHQAMASAFGARIVRATEPIHGRTSMIDHGNEGLFSGLPNPLRATRYHSLVVDEATLPDDLVVTARTDDGIPMALAHRSFPLFGVQFHPESVLTECGHQLLGNFLALAGVQCSACPSGDFEMPRPEQDWYARQPDGAPPPRW